MQKKPEKDWELVTTTTHRTYRLEVPGGWLYQVASYWPVFVPTPTVHTPPLPRSVPARGDVID